MSLVTTRCAHGVLSTSGEQEGPPPWDGWTCPHCGLEIDSEIPFPAGTQSHLSNHGKQDLPPSELYDTLTPESACHPKPAVPWETVARGGVVRVGPGCVECGRKETIGMHPLSGGFIARPRKRRGLLTRATDPKRSVTAIASSNGGFGHL